MTKYQLDVLDRESRVFNCLKVAIELLSPSEDIPTHAEISELLDFLAEEYGKAREDVLRVISAA
jgi:hypothetical protein